MAKELAPSADSEPLPSTVLGNHEEFLVYFMRFMDFDDGISKLNEWNRYSQRELEDNKGAAIK